MQDFSSSPKELFSSMWRNRSLIKAMVIRDVTGRYKGSFLGLLWSFFNPVFMLFVYTFFLSVVFKARWPGGTDSKTEFALVLFAGLMAFNLFAECINRAPGIVLSNVNYVKKVVFPLEILPIVALGSAFFHLMISFVVWLIFFFILFGVPPYTFLLVPIVLLPFCFFILGLSWGLASLGVYLRDVAQVVGVVTSALMFMSPIFYPVNALPEAYQKVIAISPLTFVVEWLRGVMIWGKIPGPLAWTAYMFMATLVLWLGFAWFQKTRKGFSDVL